MHKKIGFIGLGRIGRRLAHRLYRFDPLNYSVGYDKNREIKKYFGEIGRLYSGKVIDVVDSLEELVERLKEPKTVWLMIPHTEVDSLINDLIEYLDEGSVIIDGGNSRFKDSKRRYSTLKKKGIKFLDVGVSGGLEGAEKGPVLMIGGEEKVYLESEKLFRDLALGYEDKPMKYYYVGGPGRGHFVKAVHNAIEYGIMQSIAEGFGLLKNEGYDIENLAELFQNGSMVQSRLLEELIKGLEGNYDLKGKIGGGETGKWILEYAKDKKIKMPSLKVALKVREESQEVQTDVSKLISIMRMQFGGHKEEF